MRAARVPVKAERPRREGVAAHQLTDFGRRDVLVSQCLYVEREAAALALTSIHRQVGTPENEAADDVVPPEIDWSGTDGPAD
jgi:hypothetical protein